MINLQCDYLEGCHPFILQKMEEANLNKTPGYGKDEYCRSAAEKIRQACRCPHADIHFLVGGTQAKLIVITSLLRPYQGVLCADEGHIACHEAGAIEATGHKVICLPSENGKITAAQVEEICQMHFESPIQEHMVQPGMVYISFPTECGSLYHKEELTKLSQVCKKYCLPLYIDGSTYGIWLNKQEKRSLFSRYCMLK